MSTLSSIESIIFDHPYHTIQQPLCCWSNATNVTLQMVEDEEESVIKNETLDEITLTEVKVEPSIKQEYDDFKEDAILSADIYNTIKNEEDDSQCCDTLHFMDEESCPLYVMQQEDIVKTEPSYEKIEILNSEIILKEENENPVLNFSDLDINVIKQEDAIRSGELLEFHEIQEFPINNKYLDVDFAETPCIDSQHSATDKCVKEKPSQLPKQGLSSSYHVDKTESGYNCNFCNYNTLRKRLLTRHLKIHMNECLHKCSKCEYTTFSRRLLIQHFTTHSKAYKCTQCKYRASRQAYLAVHMRTHEKSSFQCYECNFTATHKSTLTRHFNAVHMDL